LYVKGFGAFCSDFHRGQSERGIGTHLPNNLSLPRDASAASFKDGLRNYERKRLSALPSGME
jgi:hypothetical protein